MDGVMRDGGPTARPVVRSEAEASSVGDEPSGGRPTAGLAATPAGLVTWVAVAVVGVAVGTGIGVRHLQVDGWSSVAALGLVALGVGLAATCIAGGIVVRGGVGWRRWLALPVTLVVLWFVVWPLTVALMATTVPPTRVAATTPADRGVEYRDVTFATGDGVTLSAWYFPSTTGAAVVLRHGATSTRSATLDEAVILARHGFGVLATDARGHGRSGGDGMDLGWHGDADLAAAVTYLAQQPEVDPGRIGVVGLSMGGEEALGAAAVDARIRAVVAEGVSGRGTVADEDLVLPDHPGRWFNVGQTWIQQHVTDLLTAATAPPGLATSVQAIQPRPVLLVVGEDAAGGEGVAGPRLQAVAPQAVDLWVVRDAPHIGGLATRPGQWEARVMGFLDRALAPT